MVKFLSRLLLVVPVIGIMAGFNYFVDPANLFKPIEYEREISSILLAKKNIVGISNFDERIMQRFYVNGLTSKKDVIVLGSSRSLEIGSELFPGKDFFNNSVSGASLEDYLAIYQLYRAKGLVPETIILVLDPWLLNKNNGQYRWESLKLEYSDFLKNISDKKEYFSFNNMVFRKYAELFSPDYFQESLKLFKAKMSSSEVKRNKNLFATTDRYSESSIKLSDGSWIYSKAEREADNDKVYQSAISYAAEKPVYSLGNFNILDRDIMQTLEKFIDFIIAGKTNIVFFLPPYHPAVYKALSVSAEYGIIVNVEHYFRELAARKNIKVFGSYNPDNCLFDGHDFYDGMHAKRESVEKILGNL